MTHDSVREESNALINGFIADNCGSRVAHLLDSDENDGQRLRDAIADLLANERQVGREKGYEIGVNTVENNLMEYDTQREAIEMARACIAKPE